MLAHPHRCCARGCNLSVPFPVCILHPVRIRCMDAILLCSQVLCSNLWWLHVEHNNCVFVCLAVSHSTDRYDPNLFRDTILTYLSYYDNGTIAPVRIDGTGVGSYRAGSIEAEDYFGLWGGCVAAVARVMCLCARVFEWGRVDRCLSSPVRACVCVCERERVGERERWGEKKNENLCVCVCVCCKMSSCSCWGRVCIVFVDVVFLRKPVLGVVASQLLEAACVVALFTPTHPHTHARTVAQW